PERREDDQRREDDRPGEYLEKRLADQRVVDDVAEVLRPDIGLPAGLELLAGRRNVRALAVVPEHPAALDADKLVCAVAEAERRLQHDGGIESLRLDRFPSSDGNRESRKRLVETRELCPLKDVIAARRCDISI